jgi:hypothetical protein
MRVLKLTLGKIYFLNFSFSFYFQFGASGRLLQLPDGCGTDGRMVKLHVWTRKACHLLMWQRVFRWVNEPSRLGPHWF